MSVDPKTQEVSVTEAGSTIRLLNFALGREQYAIPLLSVREVIAVPEITPLPFTPNHFLGIMNLRGQVISVLDLRIKLGVKPSDSQEMAVIICDLSPFCFGLVVDSINQVLTIRESEVADRPEMNGAKSAEFLNGVIQEKDRLVLLLDVAKTLDIADRTLLEQSKEKSIAA